VNIQRIAVRIGSIDNQILDKLNSGYYPLSVGRGKLKIFNDDRGGEINLDSEFPGAIVYIDEHPEGEDRGGYVPFIEINFEGKNFKFYYHHGEWISY